MSSTKPVAFGAVVESLSDNVASDFDLDRAESGEFGQPQNAEQHPPATRTKTIAERFDEIMYPDISNMPQKETVIFSLGGYQVRAAGAYRGKNY